MAATAAAPADLDEESWLYGEGYDTNSKTGDDAGANVEGRTRTDSALLDDLDDVIVNAEISKQKHRTNKIVSVSSNLQPKASTPTDDPKTPVIDEDGVFDLGEEDEEGGGSGEGKEKGNEDEEEEEEESESDDEDDVQIVIGPIENQTSFYGGRLPSTSNAVLSGAKKVEVDAVPTIGGTSLFEIDLDSADKPWRLPGADITDYFNYGFTEETWRLYSDKQRRTKTEVATLNKIANVYNVPQVHATRIGTLQKPGMITNIPSLGGAPLPPPPPIHHFPLPPAGLPLPPNLLPPPPLPHLGMLPPALPETTASQDSSIAAQADRGEGSKTPEAANGKDAGSDGRATPGVDQDAIHEIRPPTAKIPLLPPPTSLAPALPPPIRPNSSGAPDVTNAMAAMLGVGGLRQPEPPFPNFLPPPGFPPFHPQLAGADFRARVPPFHGGPPPPFLLPGGPLDVPGILPPPLDDRGLPIHPELGLPGGWDPSMGPPPPELFEIMRGAGRDDYNRGSRSPSRSGSSGRSRSRSRSSSYDDRGRPRKRERRTRRHSRSRSHSRDRDRHRSSRRSHRTTHHRSDRHERERDRDRDRERDRDRDRERRRREERSRRERSRRHRSSSRDRDEERSSTSASRSTRDRKTKDLPPRDDRSRSPRTPN